MLHRRAPSVCIYLRFPFDLETGRIVLPFCPLCALLERVSVWAVPIRDPHHSGRNGFTFATALLLPTLGRQIPLLTWPPPPSSPLAPATTTNSSRDRRANGGAMLRGTPRRL